MFARNYYSLVAGLREYSLEAEAKGFDAPEIVARIREELSRGDRRTLDLFYTYYDIENIVQLKAGRGRFNPLGTLSAEELEQQTAHPAKLPAALGRILSAYADPENPDFDEVDRTQALSRSLFAAYYEVCARSGCRFLREWTAFDRNLRNVCAAYIARSRGTAVADVLVGGGDVADALARSSAADFGLKGELEYVDQVMAAVADEGNLIDKERRIDNIRWAMSDELSTFDYFDVNAVLAYLVKVNIVHRWMSLDPRQGRQMYQRLVGGLSAGELIAKFEEKE